MIRKLILSAVLAAGTLGGISLTPATADAHPPVEHGHHIHFEVRILRHGHWDCYGTYHDRDEASRVAHRLQHRGFAVRVERI